MQVPKVKSLPVPYEPASGEPETDLSEWLVRCAIVACLAAFFYAGLSGKVFQPLFADVRMARWSKVFVRPSMVWGAMGLLLLSFRTALWFIYRPFRPADAADAPKLTVIIPAYNEGQMVEKSIDAVAAANYPSDRLEIIVVDDGSKDDTWQYISRAADRYPGLVTPVRFPENRGKRSALEAGFLQAKGEIVVTIDSDSVIEPDTLLAIAGPFRDPSIGAVAGKVAVYNRQAGTIPRMLHVRYTLSFDFLRAVQSTYRTVYCCPGALSAYRTKVVRQVLDSWMNQTFWGARCTYGEDRSMTNFILSLGYDVVYQRTAVVHTNVPETYTKLCKMYLRWDRSYIKEEIRFAGILWKRPLPSRLISLIDATITNLRYPAGYLVLLLLAAMTLSHPATLLRLFFVIGLMSFLNVLYYLRSERSWDFIYGVLYAYFSFFTLFWVFPFAVFTVRSRSWMTR
jgi:hyaluronan synthase